MTQDRFSAQLRQHLIESADERPADDQLAAVVAGVASTRQRPAIMARWTLNPGRVGWFPSGAVRFAAVTLALVLAATGGAMLAGGPRSTPSTVFEGTWIAIDPGDGSGMSLVVGAGNRPEVYFEDGYASGEGCVNDPVKRFTAWGTGTITGNHLDTVFSDGGGCGLRIVGVPSGHYDYDAAGDTLVDQEGLTWYRALGGDRSATPPPATDAPETASPPAFPGGTTYFSSTINRFSIVLPYGWEARPATQAWRDGGLAFDSPAADVLSDPNLGGTVYVIVGSQAYGDLDPAAWQDRVLSSTCPNGGGEYVAGQVDSYESFQRDSCKSVHIVRTETRGYVVQLVVTSDAPASATYDYNSAWLDGLLASMDLQPDETFTSSIFGYSIDYPAGWGIIPATRPWSAGVGFLEEGAHDRFSDPMFEGPRLILLIASQPYADLTPEEWSSLTLAQVCPDGVTQTRPWTVDGYDSTLFGCPYGGVQIPNGALITTEDRGYLFLFLDRSSDPSTNPYGDDWFRATLDTVDLRPQDAVDPEPAAS